MERKLTKEERILWSSAVRDVQPLHFQQVKETFSVGTTFTVFRSVGIGEFESHLAEHEKSVLQATLLPMDGTSQDSKFDRHTTERIRRGQFTIEAQIDLHGMTQTEAFCALTKFVNSCFQLNRRMTLVITGKGRSRPEGGVLQTLVPRWLNESPLCQRIVSFQIAQPRHGGNGAIYVLLKRLK
jgi:DNA-nicking Smr family endonuclease